MRMYQEIHQEVKVLAAKNNVTIIDMVKMLIENYKKSKGEAENEKV